MGVLGFGQLISAYPLCIELSKYFAVIFLLFYGGISLKSALRPKCLEAGKEDRLNSAKKTLFLLLALSLLNPHVYLDTVILLGSIASQQAPQNQIRRNKCFFYLVFYHYLWKSSFSPIFIQAKFMENH